MQDIWDSNCKSLVSEQATVPMCFNQWSFFTWTSRSFETFVVQQHFASPCNRTHYEFPNRSARLLCQFFWRRRGQCHKGDSTGSSAYRKCAGAVQAVGNYWTINVALCHVYNEIRLTETEHVDFGLLSQQDTAAYNNRFIDTLHTYVEACSY